MPGDKPNKKGARLVSRKLQNSVKRIPYRSEEIILLMDKAVSQRCQFSQIWSTNF